VCIVKPSRKKEFIDKLDRIETNEPFREEITLSEPEKQEILAYLERICLQNNIKGDKEKSAEMVNAKKWLLYHVHSSILNEIKKSEEQRKLESALSDGAPKENLDEVLKEIDSLIGLQSVKLRVKDFINLAKSYNPSNKSGMPNTHMLFLGNPGTGKTVVARLIARLLNALGLRSSGEIVEVSLSDISSQYNSGECVDKMKNFISKAMGGVLFIDEAYQLADDQWASKTLGILLKDMEDKREFLTVIFAGYEREMEKIWENNRGFKSRIPESNWFYFKDYSAEELIEISHLNLKNKKYTFNEDFAKALSEHIKTQTKRRFYKSGRDIRNLIENIERSMLQKSHSEPQVDDIPEITRFNENDFNTRIESLKQEYPGWNNLYKFLEKTALRAEDAERNNNLIDISTLHCRFIGNPGTGKTTAARHLGEIFKSMGILSNGKLLETNPMKDFVSQYQGGTAKLVRDNFERAKGGILFIDEAYQFSTISGGQEVVHQIVQTLTAPDFSDTLVIMAGYRHEMIELMKVNPGLESRLPVEIAFENMSIETLLKLFHKKIDEKNLVIRKEDEETIDRLVSEKINTDQYDHKYANVRSLNSFIESIIERQLLRIKKTKDLERYRIKPCDISDDYNTNTASEIEEALKELDSYVGLEDARKYIKILVNKRNRDKARGITNEKPIRLIFSGNPGTGKTTVARVFARIFKKLGLIPRGDLFCETRGIELQASYVGQTQQKIKDLFE
ncbi:MAG: AAA family ATPase, partial [Candidatus Riflebacteria bacterium]|nr:AAA family ATPase [Candidatus Riflebacteria bacterium]